MLLLLLLLIWIELIDATVEIVKLIVAHHVGAMIHIAAHIIAVHTAAHILHIVHVCHILHRIAAIEIHRRTSNAAMTLHSVKRKFVLCLLIRLGV